MLRVPTWLGHASCIGSGPPGPPSMGWRSSFSSALMLAKRCSSACTLSSAAYSCGDGGCTHQSERRCTACL